MSLVLYNTAARAKQPFEPLDAGHVRMYVCGPTVYQRIHVGNGRAFVVFDVLYRLLRHLYPRVTYVRNITDVEDKIIKAAAENGEPIDALTERSTRAFHDDVRALGCLPPDVEPRATDNVGEMIELIETLIAKGHAYASNGHVLFDVTSFAGYGALSGRDREQMIAGARVEVAPYKRDPADFVMWKPATGDEPGWDSAWGKGRPGWHIECSAMAERYLGLPFDIHGGGLDLVFPHHENEIAQSRCARGLEQMARYWVHNGFLNMADEKMSKSLGNVRTVEEVVARWPGEVVRLLLLQTHYRQPLIFSDEALAQAKEVRDRFYLALRAVREIEAEEGVAPADAAVLALCDDLNIARAFEALHALVTELNKATTDLARSKLKARLLASGALMGLLREDPSEALQGRRADADILRLIDERRAARSERDFARADVIRDGLDAAGVILEDRPDGTTDWRFV